MDQTNYTQLPKLVERSNWTSWRYAIRNRLEANSLLGLIDGTTVLSEPATDAQKREWRKQNIKAIEIMQTTLSTHYMDQISQASCQTAKEVWELLKSLCEVSNRSHVNSLFMKFYSYKYTPGAKMQDYILGIRSLATELKNAGAEFKEIALVNKLIHGLPDSFENVLCNFELQPAADQTIESLAQLLLRKESREDMGANESNAAKSVALAHQTKRKSKVCTFCKKKGHLVETCWKKDPTKRRTANSAIVQEVAPDESSICLVAAVNALSANTSNVSVQDKIWIGDSAAGDHMTSNLNWFSSYEPISPNSMEIILGDNSTIPVVGKGTIKIRNKNNEIITLTSVLYVPQLKRNLLSTSEIEQKGFRVIIENGKLEVSKGRKVWLTGHFLTKGQYKMDIDVIVPVASNSTVSKENVDLWHQRLGHANTQLVEKVLSEDASLTKSS